MASDSHAKRPIVVERRKEKGRKKTPRLTKTYDVKIIPATVGVVAETEEPPKKRVAAYCRVSTDQEAQETSLEEQMAHFNTVIAEHPDWELAGIYADEGISGTQVKHRVQFQQMIEDAKAKKIDLILTKSISRFARNVVDCLTNIRLLRNLRPPVSVYFDKERLDSLDEKAEVFLTMLASFAQEESRSISTNIKWATRSRMKAGTQKISTTSLLGYDTDDDGEMVIVTNEAEIVRTIYMSFDKGMHPAEIAEKLNSDAVMSWSWLDKYGELLEVDTRDKKDLFQSISGQLEIVGLSPANDEHAGQYLSTKDVQQQFGKAIFKKKFRAEHSKELDAYAESVKYFREENDGKLPSLKSLKKRKEELTNEIAERKKAYAPLKEESRRLEIASDNVYSIFRKTDEMKSDLAWKREWDAKVREKARQEQARQEQRERQPKRKKRSYDMSL